MVGQQVLKLALGRDDVAEVRALGRRSTGIQDQKLNEIVHTDFREFSGCIDAFKDVDLCLYCLGVYQSQISKDRFFEITCDYQRAFTEVLTAASPEATFVLFSAQGADPSERSFVTFAKAKGRAEKQLQQTPFPKKLIFRPGYIHPSGERRPQGLLYRILAAIGDVGRSLGLKFGILDRDLAKVMLAMGLDRSVPSGIFEQSDINGLAHSH